MHSPGTLLLHLLYPTRCILCRESIAPGRPRICPDCRERMPRADGDHTHGDFFSTCVSALYYEKDVKSAVKRYKFGGAQAYDDAFGELVAARIYEELYGRFDMLSWAPLPPDRLRRRGYDQAELIARNAAKRLMMPATPVLKKRFGVPPQSGTRGRERRKANISGAYKVISPAKVAGRRILLIDDIVTTGATLSECAKTLLLAGAEEVMCATLSKTR